MTTLAFSIQHSAFGFLAATATADGEGSSDAGFLSPSTWLTSQYFWLALAVAVLVVLGLIVRQRRRNRPLEVFTNETGRVQVAGSALAELIENAARQIGAASRPRVDFEHRGDKIHLHVRLKLAAGQRLPEFSEALKQHLASTLRDTFGLTNLGEITLTVTGFKGNPLTDAADKFTTLPPAKPAEVPAPESAPAKPPAAGHDFFSTQ